jgi:hypothetical protein
MNPDNNRKFQIHSRFRQVRSEHVEVEAVLAANQKLWLRTHHINLINLFSISQAMNDYLTYPNLT